MAATLSSKREVRDHVKQVLQPLVDDGTVETDELRSVMKAVGDAAAEFPIVTTAVEQQALGQLLTLLQGAGAGEAAVEKVKALLGASEAAQASTAEAATAPSSSSAAAPEQPQRPALSLGGFRARMAKKKEELQATAATRAETTAPSTAPITAQPSAVASVTPSESAPVRSTNASAGASPALQPSAAAAPAHLPPVNMAAASEEASERSVPTTRQGSADAPQAAKPERLVLTAAPIETEDLYAEFTRRGGRGGRGGWRGRGGDFGRGGRGGPPPYRGADDRYGRGRGGYTPHSSYYSPY